MLRDQRRPSTVFEWFNPVEYSVVSANHQGQSLEL
jgi:hypothetical protein